jgi:hypothetical protein
VGCYHGFLLFQPLERLERLGKAVLPPMDGHGNTLRLSTFRANRAS